MSRQFVVHLHSGYGPDHYDLMISAGPALATWRLDTPPDLVAAGRPAPASRLADHRAAYLSYEGPVSRGRGSVKMIDGGVCEVIDQLPNRWEVRFHGRKLTGRYELARPDPLSDDWAFCRLGDP